VYEHVLRTVVRLNETETFCGVEELDFTCGHLGLLACSKFTRHVRRTGDRETSEFGGCLDKRPTRGASKRDRKPGCLG
jgi:hypothetical protein